MTRPVLLRPFEGLFARIHARELELLGDLPGPTPVWPFGNALQLAGGDLHARFEQWREQWGDEILFWIFGKPSLLINRPDQLRAILVEEADEWHKNVPRKATEPVMGRSVFRSAGGEDWEKKRAAHPFESSWVESWYRAALPIVAEVTHRRLEQARGPIDLYGEILRVSFESFGRTVLGEALDDRAFAEHDALLTEISRRGGIPISPSPWFWWRRRSWLRRIEELVDRAGDTGGQDLVSRVAAQGRPPLGIEQLRDELSNVFTAGMKNVAICAAGVLYELLRSPTHLDAVRKEASTLGVEPDGGDGVGPDPARLRALPHLRRAVDESMRLHPVVPGFVREVAPGRKVTLGGRTLPEGTQVFITIWTVHRHPELWPDPHRFEPERFLEEPPAGHYFPFGMGRRACVGTDLTLLFAKTIVTTVLEHFDVTLDDAATFETTLSAGTAPPRHGVPATIQRRTPTRALPDDAAHHEATAE